MIPIGDDRRLPIFPFVVYLLIALNVFVFILELRAPDIDAFIDLFATIPYDITHGIVLPPPSPPVPALTILTAIPVTPSTPVLLASDDSGTQGDGITNVKQPHLTGKIMEPIARK